MQKVPEEKADTPSLIFNNSLTATRKLFKRHGTGVGEYSEETLRCCGDPCESKSTGYIWRKFKKQDDLVTG